MWDWNITICTIMKYTSLVKKRKVKHISPQTQSSISCCYQLPTQKTSFIRRQVQDFGPESLFWSEIPNVWDIHQTEQWMQDVGLSFVCWGFVWGSSFVFFLILTQVNKILSQLPEEQILSTIFWRLFSTLGTHKVFIIKKPKKLKCQWGFYSLLRI